MALLRFDEFMDAALYAPGTGFYATGGVAGRRGDFITSPEVGPLFGSIVARRLDAIWGELGEPEEFVVAEAAAGVGTLARTILAAQPACAQTGALSYVLVETSDPMRARHGDLVAKGCRSAAALPPDGADVTLANELLDNLPTRILERTETGWSEVMVDPTTRTEAVDVCRDQPEIPDASFVAVGARVPFSQRGIAWIEHALERTRHTLIIIDYGADTTELAARGQSNWLRAYRGHQRVDDPLSAPGTADITVDVPFDQLPAPTARCTQADWLTENGLEPVLEAARRVWEERAHIGDLPAMKARSALTEAGALTDPDGLGAFVIEEWRK